MKMTGQLRHMANKVNESYELSDEELANVRGGMSPPIFDMWRAKTINDYNWFTSESSTNKEARYTAGQCGKNGSSN